MIRAPGHTLQWGEKTEFGLTRVVLECSCGKVFLPTPERTEPIMPPDAEVWLKAQTHLRGLTVAVPTADRNSHAPAGMPAPPGNAS